MINMKHTKRNLILTAFLGASLACSDSNDPDTLNPEDLSPPLQLQTVTGSGKIELRWQGVNFEDDLAGYHVFVAANKGLSELAAPAYPTDVSIANNETVPFCADNANFFADFGITTAPSGDCEGAKSTPATGLALADTVGVAEASVECFDPSDGTTSWQGTNADDSTVTISLEKKADTTYRKGVGVHRCLITKDSSGTALVDGTTYSIFVVAVTGDSYDGISWTSNIVDDTPAPAVVDNQNLSLNAQQYVTISFDTTNLTKTLTVPSTGTSCGSQSLTNNICGVYGATPSTSTAGFYIARDHSSNSYPQRIFLSVPAGSAYKILDRGNQVTDPIDATAYTPRIPGDSALADKTSGAPDYDEAGTHFIVRDRQVYDFVLTVSGSPHYGKIAFGDISYATASDKSSAATIPMTIVIQPKASTTHYGL